MCGKGALPSWFQVAGRDARGLSGFVWGDVDVVEPFADDFDAEDGGVDVAGGGDVHVAQEFLDHFDGHSFPQELGGPEVAKVVGGEALVEAESVDGLFDDFVGRGFGEATAPGVAAVGNEEGGVAVPALG